MSNDRATSAPPSGAGSPAGGSPPPPPPPPTSEPLPLETEALGRAREVTIGVLLGLPALFSGVLPRLFSVAAETNTGALAVLFFAFSAAYFILPLAYISLRGSGGDVWKRSGLLALLGAVLVTCASLFVPESILVLVVAFGGSAIGLSVLAIYTLRRLAPGDGKPWFSLDQVREIRGAAGSRIPLGGTSPRAENQPEDGPEAKEPAGDAAAAPAPVSTPSRVSVWSRADARARRLWHAAPGASFAGVALLAAAGLCWMWAGPTTLLDEIRGAFGLAEVVQMAREDGEAARAAVASAARPLNPAYLLTAGASSKQVPDGDSAGAKPAPDAAAAASLAKRDGTGDRLLQATKLLVERTGSHYAALTGLDRQARQAGDSAWAVRLGIERRISEAMDREGRIIRQMTVRLDSALAGHDRATLVRGAMVASELRRARRSWYAHLAARPAVDSAIGYVGVLASPQARRANAAETAWERFLADWTDEQAGYLRLRQEQQRHLQSLQELKTKTAQRRMTAIYERVRVRGLVVLGLALAWLLFAYYREFGRPPAGHSLSPYGQYRKDSYRIGFAFLIILIVPLLPRLQEAKVDPSRPLESFTLRSWYLPGFLTQEVSEEFMEAGGLPSRGAAGAPTPGSPPLPPFTIRVDTVGIRPDSIDHREAINALTEQIRLTNESMGALGRRVGDLQNSVGEVRGDVRRVDDKVNSVSGQTSAILQEVGP
jgi:hypothetical protein